MNTYCENPGCENPAAKEVPVSIERSGDQVRSLCATCEEVYTWGVQHGKKLSCSHKQWILAIADRGIIAYAEAYSSEKMAEQGLIDYLRKEENYDGPDEISEAASWLAEHDERLSAEIFAAESGQDNNDIIATPDAPYETERLKQFLADGGFIVLGENQHDPHLHQPFEAWAYKGPLDFNEAQSVTFGTGKDVPEALDALAFQINEGRR